ncbi:MAG: TraG/TraD/VirD4 family protein, partial [Acidobacteriales bacterium]|nr:TraG/TraD/VirD4 family protein [Terriglobales bacterium]
GMLSSVREITDQERSGSGAEPYWQEGTDSLTHHCTNALIKGLGKVTAQDLYRMATTAANTREEANSEAWQDGSFCGQVLQAVWASARTNLEKMEARYILAFFLEEWAGLSDRTRSILLSMFITSISVFLRAPFNEMFGGKSNLFPEHSANGKIIVMGCPILTYGEAGRKAQVIFKYCWQRAIQSRSGECLPVCLWQDESQYYTVEADMLFQSSARSARCAVVSITQTLANYFAVLGGEMKGKAAAESMMANYGTKIFHNLAGDPVTAEWLMKMIGPEYRRMVGGTTVPPPRNTWGFQFGFPQTTTSLQFQLQPMLLASDLATLRKGGPQNNYMVDALVVKNGLFRNGRNWLKVSFKQAR